jgi:PTH1 family peptidyl-tRNA hydrolase
MKLIVGLGNPGDKYKNNRHNAGYMVVDRLVEELHVRSYGLQHEWRKSSKGKLQYIWFDTDGGKMELIKSLTFMNNSGYSVSYAYKKHSLSSGDLYLIHDDLDIKLGDYKIQKSKGPKEHNGLLSVYRSLGTKNFWHVRVGIENRPGKIPNPNDQIQNKSTNHQSLFKNHISGEKYVLQDFTDEELVVLSGVIDKIVKDLIDHVIATPSTKS